MPTLKRETDNLNKAIKKLVKEIMIETKARLFLDKITRYLKKIKGIK